MNIKSLLLGSAAALVAVSGARAADAVVVAEPEPVEYVRVCDAYGAGFFYIPGTETCLKIGGYVRYDAKAATMSMTAVNVAARGQRNLVQAYTCRSPFRRSFGNRTRHPAFVHPGPFPVHQR